MFVICQVRSINSFVSLLANIQATFHSTLSLDFKQGFLALQRSLVCTPKKPSFSDKEGFFFLLPTNV